MAKTNRSNGNSLGNRRLAAILFTDVAGFSGLVENNETRTLLLVQRDLKLISDVCHEHGGEVLKNTGDGCLATFGSVEAAVRSAMKIQKTMVDASHRLPAEQVLHHRIGIHLGDVFLGQSDVLGNGVNIAARLLGEAEPDGICVSQAVYDLVKHRLAVKAVCIGARELKNIREAMPVYRLMLDAASQEQNDLAPSSRPDRRKAIIAGASLTAAATIAVAVWLHSRPGHAIASHHVSPPAATAPATHSAVAVAESKPATTILTTMQILKQPPDFVADSAGSWKTFPQFSNNNLSCGVRGNVYVMSIETSAGHMGVTTCPWGSFRDATIEVTGKLIGAPVVSWWGVTLLAEKGPRRLVRFGINRNGAIRFDLSRLYGVDGTGHGMNPNDVSLLFDPSVHRDGTQNTILLRVQNHSLTMSVNGKPVGSPVDVTPLEPTILMTTIEGAKGASAEFDRLRVWLPH